MTCDICGADGTKVRRVAKAYGKGGSLLVIQDVPVVSCPKCGESYMSAETLHEIERIKLHRKNFAIVRPVGVADFVG